MGIPVVWYTNQPLYFTDPGDLSSSVNHAAADALVAAAANVWNVPTSSLVLSRGGALDEHVSGANTFFGPSGLIFPADVQSSNYATKQIAVIYDSDGSVTDLLLGNGASDPTGCLQNGVTESVDSIIPAGLIQHAVLVLNGRCTGPAPAQQMQLQYQLMRASGRILGLGWSQTNDNVFTGSPQATFNQAMHWPVMHPIDIICGPYTYQCMPQPFTLRPDDLSALAQLYSIGQGQAPPGKTDTLLNASQFAGRLFFSGGQGMQGVNVIGRRWSQFTDPSQAENWDTVSSVSGTYYRQSNGNPVTGIDITMAGSQGWSNNYYEGFFDLARVPMLPGFWQFIILKTEPVNPLYTGQYSLRPYVATVQPSGSNLSLVEGLFSSYQQAFLDFYVSDSASLCNPGSDGTEAAPATVAVTGWWPGLLCGYGHTAWSSLTVKGNRSLTLEVTAEDEQGFATTVKAMPVLGIWNSTDARGSLPGVASASEVFNGAATGMTTLTTSLTQPDQLRIAIADQARRRPARLQLPGAGFVRRLAESGCGRRWRRNRHDYGHGLSHGQCGSGQWRGRDGFQLDSKHHCGDCAVASYAGCQHRSGGGCYGRRPLDRRNHRYDAGFELCSAGDDAEPVDCAGGLGDSRATGDSSVRCSGFAGRWSHSSRWRSCNFYRDCRRCPVRCQWRSNLHPAHGRKRYCIDSGHTGVLRRNYPAGYGC